MAVKLPIFMDNHSTTPMDPRVLGEMLPYFTEKFGNAASRSHIFGCAIGRRSDRPRPRADREAHRRPEREGARLHFGRERERQPCAQRGRRVCIATRETTSSPPRSSTSAILDTCKRLEKEGFEVTYLGVGTDGLVDPDDVKKAITDKTILVSVMLANNEIGTVQPLGEIGKITRERGVLLHSDAVQGIGKIDFDVQRMNVDLASLTAHKMYGPKGIGALYVRRSKPRVRLVAQMDGGGHERGMRSGTSNVPSIVGFGKACAIFQDEGKADNARISSRCASACGRSSKARSTRVLRERLARAPAARQLEPLVQFRRRRGHDDGDQGRGRSLRAARPAPPPASSRATFCARSGWETSWRTRASGSESDASTPKRRSTTWPTSSSPR